MAVYREGYHIIESIIRNQLQIFPDAADVGVPISKGDNTWVSLKQLTEWYGVEGTRSAHSYSTGKSVEMDIELLDEWAVSDKRKTMEEAKDIFHVSYVTCTTGRCRGFDGFVVVYRKQS
jgi:hypothetical protein